MSLQYSPKITTDGLVMCLDPSQNKSYPTDLPVKGGLVMWMDAADDSTFSYSSGTTVSQWRDKSGYNYHMVPVSAGPTRNAFLNSRKVLAFTNTQDIQNLSIDLRTSAYSVFVVDRYTSPSSGTGRILTSNSGLNNWLLGHWASEVNKYYANGWVYQTYAAIDTNWKLYLGDWGGSSNNVANFYGAGTALATNSTFATAGPWGLGINANSGERSNCEAAEIIVFNRLLTATERRLVHTYLGQKWGISNTDRSIVDLAGNDDNGLLGNGTVANMPVYNYYNKGGLRFNSSFSNYVIGPNTTISGSQTFCVWAVMTGKQNSPTGVLSQHDYVSTANFGINILTSNQLAPSIGYTNGTREYQDKTTTGVISYNQIFNAVLVYNAGLNKIYWYINGVFDSEYSLSLTPKSTNWPIGLGRWDPSYDNYYFDGTIFSALVYNKALSPIEVAQNYEAQKSKFANTIVQQGLVLNLDAGNPYSYAGSGTTWYDVSGNAINASASGTSSYVNSNGGFLSFPNNNSYYNTSTVSALNLGSASFSMECWVYLDAATASDNTYRGIISLGTNSSNFVYIAKWRSGLYTGLYVQYKAGGSTITGVYQANEYNPVSKWTHVIATKSGSSLTLYVNGSIVYTINDLNTTFTGNSSVYVAQAHGGVASLYGYVGESRVYNISLSAAQVLQNYNATKGRFGL